MNKKLLALVGGAGLATGVLIAPDKGSRTIKKIGARGKKIFNGVKKSATGEINSVRKSIRSRVDVVKDAIRSRARTAANATLAAEEKVHRKFRSAVNSAVKSTGSVPVKKTTSRNGAANKSARTRISRVKKAAAARPLRSSAATNRKTVRHRENGHSKPITAAR